MISLELPTPHSSSKASQLEKLSVFVTTLLIILIIMGFFLALANSKCNMQVQLFVPTQVPALLQRMRLWVCWEEDRVSVEFSGGWYDL